MRRTATFGSDNSEIKKWNLDRNLLSYICGVRWFNHNVTIGSPCDLQSVSAAPSDIQSIRCLRCVHYCIEKVEVQFDYSDRLLLVVS